MKTIDVCLSPELLSLYELKNRTVVVVDIFRATSCMVTAMAHGVDEIIPFANAEQCLQMKSRGYLTSGERDGKKIEGFDKGNSPFEYMDDVQGKKIAFTTTNGTRAIQLAKEANEIVIGSFLNFTQVAKHLLFSDYNALIVCAGWKGKINMEDTLFAGALVSKLKEYLGPDCDSPLIASHLYAQASNDMYQFLQTSSHVNRLTRLNLERDIRYCLQKDIFPVLPIFKGTSIQLG